MGAGGFSGWHHHPGMVIVAVKTGVVTAMDATCGTTTYGVGQAAGDVLGGQPPGLEDLAPACAAP